MSEHVGGPAAETQPLIEADEVSAVIDGETLLAPTDIRVERGMALAVRGRNGSGKTTLLRILSGRMRPSSGAATIDGRTIDDRDHAVRRSVSALVGTPAYAPDLTLREHLRYISTTWGVTGGAADDAADELLAELRIDALARRFTTELSSGQSQIFALATALVRPFDVLILDEPEQRLDAERRALVADRIVLAKERGAAVVFASHDPGLIERIADEAITVEAP
ncbi:ABC transporter ATP-binding protein [Plantibacter sp. LMC-P-059a]|uniref:ABC transporter ATP-binding protein n=1 Tax=Plantibacter sp. LMC-P-059a TaxID=3040297 RepID=UPI00254C78E5|nr:ABC transporter ATP-binding protein [Plantibacter sp. LMC-P-059a]